MLFAIACVIRLLMKFSTVLFTILLSNLCVVKLSAYSAIWDICWSIDVGLSKLSVLCERRAKTQSWECQTVRQRAYASESTHFLFVNLKRRYWERDSRVLGTRLLLRMHG